MNIIALDLEGTLISNIQTMLPRKHLCEFVEFCIESFDKVVIFSAVLNDEAAEALTVLWSNRDIPVPPESFTIIPFLDLSFQEDSKEPSKLIYFPDEKYYYKDLGFVQNVFPNVPIDNIWLVDDDENWIKTSQIDQWIEVERWDYPFKDDDVLLEITDEIKEKVLIDKFYLQGREKC